MRPQADAHVVLLGMMGVGKTTVGGALAARLGRPYLDNDARLQERSGRSAAELALAEGRGALHALEARLLLEALASSPPAVISAPGSAVLSPPVRQALASAFCVWLDAQPSTLAARLAHPGHRPALEGDVAAALQALDAERRPLFASLAHLTLPVDAPPRPPEALVACILQALARQHGGVPPAPSPGR